MQLEELKKRVIPKNKQEEGIIIEGYNAKFFSAIKYTCHNKKYYKKLLMVKDYYSLLVYPIPVRLRNLILLTGTSDFKIRESAFKKLFPDIS